MFASHVFPLKLSEKTLALTYDDGPGPRTVEIAEFLHDRGIRATFFVVGKHVRLNRDCVRRVRELGHLIGNHTDTHQSLPRLVSEPDKLTREVIEAHREIQEFVGEGPFLLRPPFGEWSADVAAVLNNGDGLKRYFGPINWNIEYGDYEIGLPRDLTWGNTLYTLEECQQNYLQGIRKKRAGVVLFHDWSADTGEKGELLRRNNQTLELTKWLVARLDDFRFVALDEIGIQNR